MKVTFIRDAYEYSVSGDMELYCEGWDAEKAKARIEELDSGDYEIVFTETADPKVVEAERRGEDIGEGFITEIRMRENGEDYLFLFPDYELYPDEVIEYHWEG